MVNTLALSQIEYDMSLVGLPRSEVKWSSVSLRDVYKTNMRLEASVFDIEGKHAKEILENCIYPKICLIGKNKNLGFIQNAYYGGRLKRNYIDVTDNHAIGFIGSSEMLDIKPIPVKFMNCKLDNIGSLKVEKETILISRSGTIGNLTLVNNTLSKMLVSEHAIRLECEPFAGYIYSFLKSKVGQILIKSKIYGSVIQQIEPEHLADIPVPDPSDNIKKKIHDIIIRSFDLRDESNELIDEATTLLVKELQLPSMKQFNIRQFNKKVEVNNYNVKLSNLFRRMDASYHIPVVNAIQEHLRKHAGELTTVGDNRISKDIILPGRFKRVYVDEGQGRIFFGGKQIYELDPSNKKYLSLTKHSKRIKEQLELQENMVLITCSGTIGKVTLVPKHWNHWTANQHIIRVVPVNNELAGYLFIFLLSDYGNCLIRRYTYGSVVDEIDDNHVAQIPFPLLKNQSVQTKINDLALEANKKRHEAYILEQKAMKILNDEVIYAK